MTNIYKKPISLFLVIPLLIIVVLNLQTCSSDNKSELTHNRVVYNIVYQENSVINELNETVYRGMSMDANEEHYFISDFGDYYVKMFNSDGKVYVFT